MLTHCKNWVHFTTCSFVSPPPKVSCLLHLKSFTLRDFSISINHTIIHPTAWAKGTYKSFLIFFFPFSFLHCSALGYQHRSPRLLQEHYLLVSILLFFCYWTFAVHLCSATRLIFLEIYLHIWNTYRNRSWRNEGDPLSLHSLPFFSWPTG